MMARIRSLGVTPSGSAPSTVIAIVLGRCWGSVWVASTCSTSLVPMPKASAPSAPWVEVCESPQTIVRPGWVSPSCGPMTCTMPWPASPIGMQPDAELGAVLAQRLDLRARDRVGHRAARAGRAGTPGPVMPVVGTLWSSVAMVRSGGAPCGWPPAARRRPAGWSPRGRGEGRCRAGRARLPRCAPRGRPRSSPRACGRTHAAISSGLALCICVSHLRRQYSVHEQL